MATLLYAQQFISTTLSVAGGIDDSQTTGIVLASVTGVDTAKPGLIAVTWSDPLDEDVVEWIEYTSIDGSKELQGVTRGAEGGTARAHSNGAVVAFPATESHINRINDKLTGQDTTVLTDSNGNELLKTAKEASAVNEVTLTNAATGNAPGYTATGGDTNIDIKIVPKGTGVLSVAGTTNYEDNVSSDDDLPNKKYVDGVAPTDGWLTGDAMTYVSAQSVTVVGNLTTKYTPGTKIKLTNDSGTDYYTVKSSSYGAPNTTITFITAIEYALANSAITNPFYSYQDNPAGFPTVFTFATTYTGFSSDPTGNVEFSVSGGFVNAVLYSGQGTSNAATFNFTLPIAPNYETSNFRAHPAAVSDNGSWQTTMAVVGLSNNNTTAKLGIDASTISANAYGGFTASGNKAAIAFFIYPI
jgi:hypothetical protein